MAARALPPPATCPGRGLKLLHLEKFLQAQQLVQFSLGARRVKCAWCGGFRRFPRTAAAYRPCEVETRPWLRLRSGIARRAALGSAAMLAARDPSRFRKARSCRTSRGRRVQRVPQPVQTARSARERQPVWLSGPQRERLPIGPTRVRRSSHPGPELQISLRAQARAPVRQELARRCQAKRWGPRC
jgi:hypothetical protein